MLGAYTLQEQQRIRAGSVRSNASTSSTTSSGSTKKPIKKTFFRPIKPSQQILMTGEWRAIKMAKNDSIDLNELNIFGYVSTNHILWKHPLAEIMMNCRHCYSILRSWRLFEGVEWFAKRILTAACLTEVEDIEHTDQWGSKSVSWWFALCDTKTNS